MTELLRVSEEGQVLVLTLDRPQKYNAINDEMLDALYRETLRFAAEPCLQVMLLKASGKFFSAGADLNSGLVPDLSSRSPRQIRGWLRGNRSSLSPFVELVESTEKPMVVAHQGPCFGGALELSLAFDFRLAAESATYLLPETRLGAVPSAGGTARLTRLVGPHWARWLLIAGQQIDAAKAEAIGLIHDRYPDAEFAGAVDVFCQSLAEMPPETVAAAKLAIELAADLGTAGARNLERLTASSLVFGQESEDRLTAARARLRNKR